MLSFFKNRCLLILVIFLMLIFEGFALNPSFFLSKEAQVNAATIQTSVSVMITVCGNGLIETGEVCDDGTNNGRYGYCKADCSDLGPYCGDDSCNSGETCSSCSTDCGACSSGGGGGGGGGYVAPIVETKVIFSGRAYPKSSITLLKDAQVSVTTIAGADANFQLSISGLSGGNYVFSIYSEDNKGIRSSLLTFPVSVTSGATTNVSGIFIAPTIAVDKSEVKKGDNIAIFGQSAPQSEITISVNSDEGFFNKVNSDANGAYLYNFDTSILDLGQHFTKSKAAFAGSISSFSKAMGFTVGTKNVAATPVAKCPAKSDLNSDCKVNLVDFSIAAYWYKRPLSAAFKIMEGEKLNNDGKIDLIDFSIMAYYWTG